jgi:hypothetical protein
MVERTNACHGRDRRNSKDSERQPTSSAIIIHMNHIHLRGKRLAPPQYLPATTATAGQLHEHLAQMARHFRIASKYYFDFP